MIYLRKYRNKLQFHLTQFIFIGMDSKPYRWTLQNLINDKTYLLGKRTYLKQVSFMGNSMSIVTMSTKEE